MTSSRKLRFSIIFEVLICVFFTWYFLPICNALLWTNLLKVAFFACFVIGGIGLILIDNLRFNKAFIAIVAYLCVFTVLWLLDVGDAEGHIRVSFSFWGAGLLCFGVLNNERKIRIGKFLLVIYLLTVITSSVGVVFDNGAARTIAHAGADDAIQAAYKMKNISSIYLFQCLVCFVPVLIFLPKTRKEKSLSVIGLILILFVLINASFTISLIVYAIAILLSIVFKQTNKNRIIAFLLIITALTLIVLNGPQVLTWLGAVIDNEKISTRIIDLRDLIYSGDIAGAAGMRWRLYTVSIETFFDNIFGVGVHYSYNRFENGIGYHSQFLDDMARYGIFALLFYGVFLSGYGLYLKKAWAKMGCPKVGTVITLIYFVLLVLNLGFRSADESIVMLFIMPTLPLIIEKSVKHRKGNFSE